MSTPHSFHSPTTIRGSLPSKKLTHQMVHYRGLLKRVYAYLLVDDLSVKERLEENPRSGRPPRITAEQTCQLVAIACTPPSDPPTSHWTPRELAEEVMA